jgi:hypothetical protein
MNELEPRARALIDAAREADEPSPADRSRIKHAIILQVATVGAVASAGSAAAGAMSVGAKLGVAILAASLVGGGAVGLMKLRETRETALAAKRVLSERTPAARTVARVVAEDEPATVAEVVAAPRVESRLRKADKARKVSEQTVAEAIPEDRLNAEVAVLTRAREALRMGRPAQALRALSEYDQLFGKGALGEERQAMAAIALCQAQPGVRAREQAEAFLHSAPTSPLVERVRAACITPALKASP